VLPEHVPNLPVLGFGQPGSPTTVAELRALVPPPDREPRAEVWGLPGLSGVLTKREMSYCRSRSRPAEHMAARQSVGLGKTDGEYMINVDVDQDIPDVRQRCPSEWRVALWSLRIGRVRGH
jgi:hypothetical protein